MQPLLSADQEALVGEARRLAARFADRAARHDREASFPFDDFADLRSKGFLTLTLPKAFGGAGISLYEFCLVQETLAQGSGATALGMNMHLYNLGGAFSNFTPAFQKRLADLVRAEGAIVASSLSEPHASLGSPQVTARKVDGGYEVTGRKYFCTLAPILRFFLFNARLEGFNRPGLSGTVTLAAERGSAGMEIVETWDAMGMRASGSHDIEFSGCFIPDECLVGPEGAGTESGLTALPWYALGIAAVYTGVAGAAYAFAIEHAQHRTLHPLPATIAHLPGTQFAVAEMTVQLEAARAMFYKVAQELSRGAEFGDDLFSKVTMPQYFATRTALEVVSQAMQAVGGPSLFRKHSLERLYRDVRAGTLHPYTHYWLLEMLGKRVLGIPLDAQPRWM